MRIPSASTDRFVYFVAVDATDLKTRETGLSGFTVRYSLQGGASAAMTTPTVNETDVTNMPGVYELLLDESGMTTLTAGHDTEELCLHITHASMAAVTRVVEIHRPKFTEGSTMVNDPSLAQINTEVDTALTDIRLDHLLFTSVAGTDVADNSVVAMLVSKAATADWDTYVNTTDSLEATRDAISALNNLSAAQVNTEVDTALSDIRLDHLLAVAVTGTDVADDSVFAKIVSKAATADWDTFVNTTDSLEAIRDNMSAGGTDWSAGEREQIRDALGIDGTKTTATGGQLQVILTDTSTDLPAQIAGVKGLVAVVLALVA